MPPTPTSTAPLRSVFLADAGATKLATIYDSSIQAFRRHNADRDVVWTDDADAADCVVLFEEWDTRFWNYAETLLADAFFARHWRKILTVNCDDLGRGFLPGCYTALTQANFDRRLHRACAYPYTYNELVADGAERERAPQWLYSFRGNVAGLPVRKALFAHLAGHSQGRLSDVSIKFHSHSEDQKREYIAEILDSKFVLCPRGQGPASYRLFEVMELGRCPVIVSDDWVPIDGVDWADCAIVFKERAIPRIRAILESQQHLAAQLGRNARATWTKHFSERAKFRAMFDALVEIRSGLLETGLDYRARWNTWSFHRANGWLPHQRLAARLRRMIR